MSEIKAHNGVPERETTGPAGEYNTRWLGTGRFEVYRLLSVKPGGQEIHYAECKTAHAAQLTARALNIVAAMEGWIVETIPYPDGHIFIVVKGAEAKESYLKVLPILRSGEER